MLPRYQPTQSPDMVSALRRGCLPLTAGRCGLLLGLLTGRQAEVLHIDAEVGHFAVFAHPGVMERLSADGDCWPLVTYWRKTSPRLPQMEHFSQSVRCSPLAKTLTAREKLVISWPDWVVRSSGSLPRRPTAVMFSSCSFGLRSWMTAYWMPVEWPQPFLQELPELGVERLGEP